MRELFDFLQRYSKWFVFIIYVAIGCVLFFGSDPYRRHIFLTSASSVSAMVYEGSNAVTSYFGLRKANNDLNRRNAELSAEVIHLREQIRQLTIQEYPDTMVTPDSVLHFNFVVANVINNSIYRPHNYLTIDKGAADGLVTELGVIDQNGVVGIVSAVGEHYSQVISLLNPDFRLSCKIKGSEHFGSLVWAGQDPEIALLEELPRHTIFNEGDTVITSGFSAVFPAGIPVGTIMDKSGNRNENFFTLKVKLFADFGRLSNVQVVINNRQDEVRAVENNRQDHSSTFQ